MRSDPSMNSYNHYAYGAVTGFLYRRLAGIAPASPGFRRIDIHPLNDPRLPYGGGRYRSVDLTSNIINTYAGTTFGYDGDNHSLVTSQFSGPGAITFDSSGNPILADLGK